MTRPRRALGRDELAVSDVVGSILMVAITVLVMAGVALIILNLPGPEDEDRADLVLTASPGAGGWDTGDETFTVRHAGGEALRRDGITVISERNGIVNTYSDAALDGDWADGELTIGESWSATMTLAGSDRLKVQVIGILGSSSRILTSATLLGGDGAVDCSGDTSAPMVGIWVQAPTDVDAATSGSITVTATLSDDCIGVDNGVDPSLEYRVDNGTWLDSGAMTRTATNRWSGAIPDLIWATQAGNTLQYRLVNMTDEASNIGTSVTRSDLVELLNTYTYPSGGSAGVGTLEDFAASQSASDSGAVAFLNESMGDADLHATAATGSGAQNPTNAIGVPDDVWGIIDSNGEVIITDGFDTSGFSGTISSVEIVMESHTRLALSDDDVSVAYETTAWHTILSDYEPPLQLLPPYDDDELVINITAELTTWTWQDIEDLRLRVRYDKQAGPDNVDVHVDALFLRVGTSGSANSLQVQYDFPALPPTSGGELQLDYRATGDSFGVEVWDGSSWNARGTSLNSGTFTQWSYTLTSQEKEPSLGMGPIIRFVDDTPGGGTRGVLEIDYARVNNS